MTPQEQAAAVARIRWRVPITEYVGAAGGGYTVVCHTCSDHKLPGSDHKASMAAVNRWVNEHRRWHQQEAIPDESALW